MLRGPSPQQVCLLILLDIYSQDVVPESSRLRLLTFIASHLLPHGALANRPNKNLHEPYDGLTLRAIQDVLDGIISIKDSTNLWELFTRIATNVKDFDEWFESLSRTLNFFASALRKGDDAEPQMVIALPSLFGTAIREIYLEFKGLEFKAAVHCWQAFERFTADIRPDSSSVPPSREHGPELSDVTRTAIFNAADLERLLNFQIDAMQRLGCRLPSALIATLKHDLLRSQHNADLINYAEFLDAWYAGDASTSLEKLHRYYDYAMLNKDRSQYQYALLNTAIVQADFGCRREAIAAIQETITTARENKDIPCLNFSMSWLCHFQILFGDDISHLSEDALLLFDERNLESLKVRAQESKMWSVVSATLLNQARHEVSVGQRPAAAFEQIYQASLLSVGYGIKPIAGAQVLTHASICHRIGSSALSLSYRRILTSGVFQDVPAEDLVRARCEMCSALIRSGLYREAQAWLDQCGADSHRSLKSHQLVSATSLVADLRRFLQRDHLDMADVYLQAAIAAPFVDHDTSLDIALLELDYLEKKRDYPTLLAQLDRLAEKRGGADVAHRMRIMTYKAFVAAQLGKPEKGLSLCFRALVAALDARLVPNLCEAAARLAQVLLAVGESEAAEQISTGALPMAHECGDASTLALLLRSCAQAAALTAAALADDGARQEQLRRCVYWSEKAYTAYKSLENRRGQHDALTGCVTASIELGQPEQAEQYRRALEGTE